MLRSKSFCGSLGVNRLHSSCHVYTVTGRMNMHSPNLQFVPRDFDVDSIKETGIDDCDTDSSNECSYEDAELFGITLRNMFIPCKGNALISADYSQIELRLLAHLSGDKKLLSLLNGGGDVFRMVASTLNKIRIDQVTDVQRHQAKQICYSIIYGVSAQTLSKQLAVMVEEADYFMKSFLDTYPGVKAHLKKIVDDCRKLGFILTLAGRRRYLPSIKSDSNSERGQAERQAVNTTIQGSAADLVKTAMIRIEQDMTNTFSRTLKPMTATTDTPDKEDRMNGGFLVLQLHDELIYEVGEEDIYMVARIVKKNMENSMKLKVKIPVKVKVGSSWGEMNKLEV